jgi:hypothetical protein
MPAFAAEQWLDPWERVRAEHRAALESELTSEIGPGHPLYRRPARAIARRSDCDDVLFHVESPEEFVVVHLTYASHPEEPPWPHSERFSSLPDFTSRPSSLPAALARPDHAA